MKAVFDAFQKGNQHGHPALQFIWKYGPKPVEDKDGKKKKEEYAKLSENVLGKSWAPQMDILCKRLFKLIINYKTNFN
jgi:hypothetical protein